MEIALALKENSGLDSLVSPIFGRCDYFMFIDPQTNTFSIEANPAVNETGGAGIKAAQMMVDRKVQAVLSGDVGPKAAAVLMAEGIKTIKNSGCAARDAIQDYLKQQAGSAPSADVKTNQA